MTSRSAVLLSFAAIIFALTLAPAPAHAQVKTTFGVEGGINMTNVDFTSGDPEEFNPSFDGRTRAAAGMFVAWDFNPNAGLQIDALYTQKGAKTSFTEADGTRIDLEASLDYIEIPILFRGNFRASDTVTVRLFGGPAFGIKMSDDMKLSIDGVDFSEEDNTTWKSYDMSLAIGGAVQFGKVFVDARYTFGLINVLDDDVDKLKGRTFGVMIGFSFN